MVKTYASAAAAHDGLLRGGIPEKLIAALHASGVKDLTVISNNAGFCSNWD